MTRPHPRNSGLIGLESGLDIRIFGSPQVTQCRAKVKSHCGGGQLLFLQASTAICNPLPSFLSTPPPAKSRFCMGGQTSLITRCAGPSTMTCSWPSSAAAALRPSSTFSPPAQVGLLRRSSRSQLPPSPRAPVPPKPAFSRMPEIISNLPCQSWWGGVCRDHLPTLGRWTEV